MKKNNRTEKQLLNEIRKLKTRISDLESTLSESKLSERKLRESEEKLRLITENTTENIAIVTFDLKATYLYVNPSVKIVLGYEPEDLVGKSFFEFIHPDDKKALYPVLKNYVNLKVKKLLTGKNAAITKTIEYRFKNKKGNWRHLQSTINIAGKRLLSLTRDITEHKMFEKELMLSNEKYKNVIEHSIQVFYIHDRKHNITYISPQSKNILGHSPEEMMVKWTTLATDNPINDIGFKLTEEAMQTGRSQKPYNLELKRNDGKSIFVRVNESPLKDKDGKVQGIIGSLEDITEKLNAEIELEKYKNHLEELVKKRTQELEQKNKLMDDSMKVFAGREMTILNLKKQIKELGKELESYKR